jgi:hypothetical protein
MEFFNMNKRPLIKAMAVAGFSAGMLISVAANAAHTESNFPAVVQSTTLPADMAGWMTNNGTDYSWNPVNARLGTHPDRLDGVIYIFPDEATADAWWDGVGTPPASVPDDAVAYVHWALDNDSGEFPGIMAKTDDFDFGTNNCIMASGNTIPELSAPNNEKTCSNAQGTAKRFKLVVLKADTPIDLVFNTETADLVYSDLNAVCNAAAVPPDVDVCDDLFRNYRYIMKWGNGTGTDTETEVRNGTRLVGYQVELGYGVGDGAVDPNKFVPSASSDGLSYETRELIDAPYFNKEVDGDPVEVWSANEFATISPSMYSNVGDDRAPLGGFWDKAPAGIYPPQTVTEDVLNSGFNSTTANYFDVAATQGAASGVVFPDNMFGYLMYYGIFEEGDPGNISSGIYIDEDGNPATEGSIYAWWDGTSPTCCYRWGIDGSVIDGVEGPDAFGLVSDEKLAEIASRPLDEHQVLDPPRYEIAYTDDLGGLNSDTYIKLDDLFDASTKPIPNTFTVRFTAHSTTAASATDPGVSDGAWVANPPMQFADFPQLVGTLQFNPVTYSIDENSGSITVTVERTDGAAGEVTVDYQTINGSAIAGNDFTAKSGTLTFADTVVSQTIQVTLLGDSIAESEEDFTIQISNATGGAMIGADNTATIAITDSDTPVDPEEPAPAADDDDDGLFGLSLSWMTGLLALPLLLRRKRF